MNSNNTPSFYNFVRHVDELPHDLVGGIRAIIEVEFCVIDRPIEEHLAVVQFVVESDDKFDIPPLEVVEAIQERLR